MSQREWAEKDYYKVLGVDKSASKDDIKRAYRKLAQKFHPDANAGDSEAEARFKEISEAHAILSNDEKRAEYDQLRSFVEAGGQRFYGFRPGAGGPGNVRINIGDLFGDGDPDGAFSEIFGFGNRDRRGADLETEVNLSFDEAVAGATVTLPEGGRARIPAGVLDGARIKVGGRGGRGQGNGQAGDLYVRVNVKDHPIFTRHKGGDLSLVLPVTIAEAALGANAEVPTLDGSVTVKIPSGVANGTKLRVKGRGAPKANGGIGDLIVKVEVQVPKKLSRKEKDLIEEFARIHKESPRSHLERYLSENVVSQEER